MTDKVTSPVATEIKAPAKTASIKKMASKPKSEKPSHPSTAHMVLAAIKALHERGGSSLRAIKKYIAGTYKVDTERLAPFIKKYIKSAVVAGTLVQTKGIGASGSFKLPAEKKTSETKKVAKKSEDTKKSVDPKKSMKKTVNKKNNVKATEKVGVKKTTKNASANKSPKKTSVKAATKVTEAKSPSKAKKVSKAPTTKPKAPKPKKLAGPKVAPKKTTSKK